MIKSFRAIGNPDSHALNRKHHWRGHTPRPMANGPSMSSVTGRLAVPKNAYSSCDTGIIGCGEQEAWPVVTIRAKWQRQDEHLLESRAYNTRTIADRLPKPCSRDILQRNSPEQSCWQVLRTPKHMDHDSQPRIIAQNRTTEK